MSKNKRRPAARGGLGRGLDALMGDHPVYSPTGGGPTEIPLDEIDVSGSQPRRRFVDQTIAELAQSIASHGVLQPILVEPVGSRYRIIAGGAAVPRGQTRRPAAHPRAGPHFHG